MEITEYLYDWTFTGYNPVSSGWQICDPGHYFGPGIREFFTIHFVLSGTGTLVVKGKEYHPKAGDLFAFPPYETVFYKADEQDPWHYVWINFIINGQVPYMFETSVISAPFLRPIFEGLQNYPDHEHSGRSYATNCLRQIAGQLSSQQSETRQLVVDVIQYIQLHYTNPSLSISEIAEKLHISRSTLSTVFSCEKKLSPIEYLIRFRLEKACEYMAVQKISPSVAAYSVGYKNYSNFSNIFKKYYGISPKEFQKNALAMQDQAAASQSKE